MISTYTDRGIKSKSMNDRELGNMRSCTQYESDFHLTLQEGKKKKKKKNDTKKEASDNVDRQSPSITAVQEIPGRMR